MTWTHRLDIVKEKINELEGIAVETVQNETKKFILKQDILKQRNV